MKLLGEKIPDFGKILIFGKNSSAIFFIKNFHIEPENVIGFVESQKSSDTFYGGGGQLAEFNGKKIFSVDEIKDLEFDKIFIANRFYVTLEQVLNLGIPEEKIAICDSEVFEQYQLKNPNGKPIKFFGTAVITHKLLSDFQTIDEHFAQSGDDVLFFSSDYVRTGTLSLLAKEIHDQNISGDIAEFGVEKGDFSKFINEVFPDRTLHLFDSFDNQSDKELSQYDSKDRKIKFDPKIFAETSVDLVMSKMKHPERVEVHKGFFPDTIPAEEKTFAFVSIDLGPYIPTLEGLKYFYPRLSIGGYIMLRCYHLMTFEEEMRRVVNDFEKEFGRMTKVPIPDMSGTLVITK